MYADGEGGGTATVALDQLFVRPIHWAAEYVVNGVRPVQSPSGRLDRNISLPPLAIRTFLLNFTA